MTARQHGYGYDGSSAPFDLGDASPLDLRVRAHGDDGAEVVVAGEVDFATHGSLLDTLAEELEGGRRRLVLDLRGVPFCDSTGLGVLVQVRQRAVATGGWLRVVAPTEAVRRALEITSLDRLIPAYPTAEEAFAAP